MRYNFGSMKPYTLEVYDIADPGRLLWKRDATQPFAPMARGDRLVLPEAPNARFDQAYRIDEIEHVVWTLNDDVRFVTRLSVTVLTG